MFDNKHQISCILLVFLSLHPALCFIPISSLKCFRTDEPSPSLTDDWRTIFIVLYRLSAIINSMVFVLRRFVLSLFLNSYNKTN